MPPKKIHPPPVDSNPKLPPKMSYSEWSLKGTHPPPVASKSKPYPPNAGDKFKATQNPPEFKKSPEETNRLLYFINNALIDHYTMESILYKPDFDINRTARIFISAVYLYLLTDDVKLVPCKIGTCKMDTDMDRLKQKIEKAEKANAKVEQGVITEYFGGIKTLAKANKQMCFCKYFEPLIEFDNAYYSKYMLIKIKDFEADNLAKKIRNGYVKISELVADGFDLNPKVALRFVKIIYSLIYIYIFRCNFAYINIKDSPESDKYTLRYNYSKAFWAGGDSINKILETLILYGHEDFDSTGIDFNFSRERATNASFIALRINSLSTYFSNFYRESIKNTLNGTFTILMYGIDPADDKKYEEFKSWGSMLNKIVYILYKSIIDQKSKWGKWKPKWIDCVKNIKVKIVGTAECDDYEKPETTKYYIQCTNSSIFIGLFSVMLKYKEELKIIAPPNNKEFDKCPNCLYLVPDDMFDVNFSYMIKCNEENIFKVCASGPCKFYDEAKENVTPYCNVTNSGNLLKEYFMKYTISLGPGEIDPSAPVKQKLKPNAPLKFEPSLGHDESNFDGDSGDDNLEYDDNLDYDDGDNPEYDESNFDGNDGSDYDGDDDDNSDDGNVNMSELKLHW